MGQGVQSATRSTTLREVCRSGRTRTIHDLEQKPYQYHEEEYNIDTVNIISIIFISNQLVITANLNSSSNQVSIIVPYKVDTFSAGKIIPLHLYKILFPRATKEQLAATTNKNIQLKTYNRTIITQLGVCEVKIEHNNKQRMCKFFVIPGNGQTLLGMPDINTLSIIHINCNTIDTQETDRANKCSTNTAMDQGPRHEHQYPNMMQEADRAEKCYTNTDRISKFHNKDAPMVIDNELYTINYFLPGPNEDNNKRASAEITQEIQRYFKELFTGIGCFHGMFSLQIKPDHKPYQAAPSCVAYALQKPFKEELE